MEGTICAGVVDRDSGRLLAAAGNGALPNVSGAAVAALIRVCDALDGADGGESGPPADPAEGETEDVMITSEQHFHLLRRIDVPAADPVVVYVRLRRGQGNPAACRRELGAATLRAAVAEALGPPRLAAAPQPVVVEPAPAPPAAPPPTVIPLRPVPTQRGPVNPAPPPRPAQIPVPRPVAGTAATHLDSGPLPARPATAPVHPTAMSPGSSGSIAPVTPLVNPPPPTPRTTAFPAVRPAPPPPARTAPPPRSVPPSPLPRERPRADAPATTQLPPPRRPLEDTPPPPVREAPGTPGTPGEPEPLLLPRRVRGAHLVGLPEEPPTAAPEPDGTPRVLRQGWTHDVGTLRRLLDGLRRMG